MSATGYKKGFGREVEFFIHFSNSSYKLKPNNSNQSRQALPIRPLKSAMKKAELMIKG